MTFDLYAKLDSFAKSDSTTTEVDDSRIGFPEPSDLTLATLNLYDNGPDTRGKWSSARYVLNWQMFDLTTPFTPHKSLAVWSGATQLHEPYFFESYFDAKGHGAAMGADSWQFYREVVSETLAMAKVEGKPIPMLGQFISKYPGSVYHYGCMARAHWDEFGELTTDLFLDRQLHARILVDQVANNLKDPKNLLRGRYDPQRLWRGRGRKAKA